MPEIRQLVARHRAAVDFAAVYIEEAHAVDGEDVQLLRRRSSHKTALNCAA